MSQVTGSKALHLTSTVFTPASRTMCSRAVARIQTMNGVNALVDKAWAELQQLAEAEKYGLRNILLQMSLQLSPESQLSTKVNSLYKLAEVVNQELGCSPEKPVIQNPFCIEQYLWANEWLKQFLDESLTELWNQGILPQLDVQCLVRSGIPFSPEAIRAYLNDPANAPHLAKITILALRGPGYKMLPPEINRFPRLAHLMLSELSLASFSPDLTGLTELREIFLTKCPLSDFSVNLSPCVKLERLIITHCSLKSFSPPSPLPSTLKRLDLSHNSLEKFDIDFARYPLLRDLDLSDNSLTTFRPHLSRPLRLDTLDLSSNPLQHIGIKRIGQYFYLVVFPVNPLHSDRVKAPAVEFPQVGPMFQNMAPLAGISTPGLSRGPSGKDFRERPLVHDY